MVQAAIGAVQNTYHCLQAWAYRYVAFSVPLTCHALGRRVVTSRVFGGERSERLRARGEAEGPLGDSS